jgi:hypothetical protein
MCTSYALNSHTTTRLDDIFLPSALVKKQRHPQLFCYPDDRGYEHSDHIPLIANIPLSYLGVAVKNIQQQASATKREKVLLRTIKKCDQEKLQCALKDPTYKPTIQHAELLPRLNTMHDIAQSHLARLEDKCAKIPNRLTHFQGSPAEICVENMAEKVVNLINECHKTALQTWATKNSTTGNTHFKQKIKQFAEALM